MRVNSIGEAADRRTQALENLKLLKARQLHGNASAEEIQTALVEYERSYKDVERLRNILPGVRIRPPPVSAGLAQKRMLENEAAAKQYLGIEMSSLVEEDTTNQSPQSGNLSLPLVLILSLVLVSQIGLLLLLANDPMADSSWSVDPAMSMRQTSSIVDTITGLE